MRFNINQSVRVKLNTKGFEALRENHRQLYASHPRMPAYIGPKVDAEGWTTFQLWCLMRDLGPHITMGFEPPFETEIEILEGGQ